MKGVDMHFEKKSIRKITILIFWLFLWQLLAFVIDNSILFAGPIDVIRELISETQNLAFYQTIGMSLIRIVGGFAIGFLGGMLLGIAGFFYPLLDEVLAPFISLMKSVPIASFVVILLIWAGSNNLAVFISIIVVLPNAYLHTRMGLKSTDDKLLEMADVFHVSILKRLHFLYFPAMMPYLISCIEVVVGLSFKSGVAAEVIGTPEFSFGEKLYMSKIQLNTPGIFAWTIVIILASFLVEKCILLLFRHYEKKSFLPQFVYFDNHKKMSNKSNVLKMKYNDILIENLSKEYQGKMVFNQVNLTLEKGKTYCIMGPSGCGKTTFLHILLGLVKPDQGRVKGITKQEVSAVFQEARLLDEYTAIDNAFLFGMYSKGNVLDLQEFKKILPEDAAGKLVKELSGGMQRRVAIMRAMVADSSLIVLDEPFSGLDEETKKKTAEYILEQKGTRTLIVSTHSLEEVALLKGEILDGNKSGFNWNYGRR